ncbi:hypothetical protein VKT23_004541 [Stygiomarasmius scandens]|uniref:Heterokaryon incompatibility domain-containing protein n=1 Tax=Marasmiellus scandens TaxID=2682957 RepID=A0ABR1JUD9_9AGAR
MRLLNTKTFHLQEFHYGIPKYAILSHTWGEDEVTFQDIQPENLETRAKLKAGWLKVEKACIHALKYGFKWIWIDTCCINKESSAELSEAINSMYQYYEDAEVCYVYLFDGSSGEDPRDAKSSLWGCRWFERGWTLQELLAPSYVVFLDKEWIEIGTRWSLRDVVSAITSIPSKVFEGDHIWEYSIAQRMSWAASRKTTRPEDMAYCLMGIFGVSMPPIYGEGGPKAFMRLQQQIIQYSDDRSIFAWIASSGESGLRGLLARSPFEFRASGEVGVSESNVISSYIFGNNGLRIHLPLQPWQSPSLYLASLHCRSEKDGNYVAVYLQRTPEGRYVRCCPDQLPPCPPSLMNLKMHEIIVKETTMYTRRAKEMDPQFHLVNNWKYIKLSKLPAVKTNFILDGSNADLDEPGRIRLAFSKLTYLKFRTLDGREQFTILWYCNDNYHFYCELVIDGKHNLDKLRTPTMDSGSQCPDRFLALLDGLGTVSLAVHMSGFQSDIRILELDFSSSKGSLPRQLRPPNFGFVASNRKFYLKNVFPPDPFKKKFGNQTYISIPDTDPLKTYRLLTFKLSDVLSPSFSLYVIVGVHGSIPWTDILLEGYDYPGMAEEIWNSYPERAKYKARSISASVIHHRLNVNLVYTVTIKERSSLQLGTHVLFLDHFSLPDSSRLKSSSSLSYPQLHPQDS